MPQHFPIEAGFLGPKAEHCRTWSEILNYILQDYIYWRRNYFPEDEQILDRRTRRDHESWFDVLSNELDKVLNQLKADYPFYSPRYQGHMVSENLAPGIIGYFAGMLYNPNNVSSESAPITLDLELESGRLIAKMLGYNPTKSWSHITSGGTIANLEAIWAARQNQLNGVAFKEICDRYHIPFDITLPNGHTADIRNVDTKTLICLAPEVQVKLPTLFKAHHGLDASHPSLNSLMKEVKYGPYSITRNGLHAVYSHLNIEPVILASQAAHYSIRKTANLLGLGEKNVILLSVDDHFRVDMKALEATINSLNENQVILALIGILGTTEVGAIDPIDEMLQLRSKLERERNQSFWFHVDAAWGGYLKTLDPEDACFSQPVKRVLKSLAQADSITIDPHKMGYIPYPSGVINFKDKHAVLHSHQVAPYITLNHDIPNPLGLDDLDESVGPYIIEGSKPGAAAVATWLTHKTIPLNPAGHGKMIKASLENAQRFFGYIEKSTQKQGDLPIMLTPIGSPDCNVVCYFFEIKGNAALDFQNQLNKRVYAALSLNSSGGKQEMPYRKEYFISHTHFFPSHYSFDSVANLMRKIHEPELDYGQNGLFILRSVIMNPWLDSAREKETDHLENLIKKLYSVAEEAYHELKDSFQPVMAHGD